MRVSLMREEVFFLILRQHSPGGYLKEQALNPALTRFRRADKCCCLCLNYYSPFRHEYLEVRKVLLGVNEGLKANLE